MNSTTDWDKLMADDLDGTISPRDRLALERYFEQNPAQRALVESMRSVDVALHALPIAQPPQHFATQVMGAVSSAAAQARAQARNTPQPLRPAQIAFLVISSSVLVFLVGLAALALWMLLSPAFPRGEFQALFVFARGVFDLLLGTAQVVLAFLRAVYSQPAGWLITLGMAAIVGAWLRIVTPILIPRAHFASA
jgi:anti-sigma factor RsiW